MTHGFTIIATPVIGVSQHVGLPVDRAYRILLSAFFRAVVASDIENEGCPIDELRVFDLSDRKVELMAQITVDILTELGLDFRAYDARRFEIQEEEREMPQQEMKYHLLLPLISDLQFLEREDKRFHPQQPDFYSWPRIPEIRSHSASMRKSVK